MELKYHIADIDGGEVWVRVLPLKPPALYSYRYDPLHDDGQMVALVKKFAISIVAPFPNTPQWECQMHERIKGFGNESYTFATNDLNRAICECVAKMQEGK